MGDIRHLSAKNSTSSPYGHELYSTTLNTTTSLVTKYNSETYSTEINVLIISLSVLVLLIGVTGNSMVCLYLGQKNLRKKTDLFLISLAFSDLVATLIGPIDNIITYSFEYTKLQLDETAGKVMQVITYVTLAVSSWTLVAIACDRFWAIVRPIESYKITDRIRLLTSLLIWVTAIVLTSIFIFAEKVGLDENMILIYTIVLVILAWGIPIPSIIILYSICSKKFGSRNIPHAISTIDQQGGEKKRVITMFVVITAIFFVSAFPATLVSFVFVKNNDGGKIYLVREFTFIIMLTGCAVNPFIYAKMHKEIHGFLVRVWKRIRRDHSEYSIESATAESNL